MGSGRSKVRKSRGARNLGYVNTGPGNKGNTRPKNRAEVVDQSKIQKVAVLFVGFGNRLRYEQYGDRNNNYNLYYDYYEDSARNTRPRMPAFKTEIPHTSHNQPLRIPPCFEKGNDGQKKIDNPTKRIGESRRKSQTTIAPPIAAKETEGGRNYRKRPHVG